MIVIRLIDNATANYLKRLIRLHRCLVIVEVLHDIRRIIVAIRVESFPSLEVL